LKFHKIKLNHYEKITIDRDKMKNDEPSSKGTELNMGTTPRDMGSTQMYRWWYCIWLEVEMNGTLDLGM
jgi:hypothetical protein